MARQDAERNQLRLLDAAEEVFRTEGFQAPLALVMERAGVGRGTLYRHFPDRERLVMALAERLMNQIEQRLAQSDDARSVEATFHGVIDLLCAMPGLAHFLSSFPQGQATIAQLQQRIGAALAEPLAAARRSGLVRPGVTTDDFVVSWAMVEGALLAVPADQRAEMMTRARALLVTSLFTVTDRRDP